MKYGFPLVLTALLALGGCSTFEGLKSDITNGYNSLLSGTDTAEAVTRTNQDDPDAAKKRLPVYDGSCPGVSVRPDLRRLVEFYNADKPSDATKISEVTLTNVQNICRVEADKLVMQIDLTLDGKTGPKARMKPTDKPSFAYPYLVAVTDAQGNVLSKDIFAASIAYGADQKDIKQTESIFQNMPFPDATIGQVYTVVVGFQLTPEQLAYNQAHPNP